MEHIQTRQAKKKRIENCIDSIYFDRLEEDVEDILSIRSQRSCWVQPKPWTRKPALTPEQHQASLNAMRMHMPNIKRMVGAA